VRHQAIGVLATQDGSVQHAHLLRQWSDDVVFFAHTEAVSAEEQARLGARGIEIIDGTVARLLIDDDNLTGLELDDGRVIPRSPSSSAPRTRRNPPVC
jgi:thioredoxin reductase